jgi:CRISPR/Cas system endoribonuclease Cas6 (RAMP superfamily)
MLAPQLYAAEQKRWSASQQGEVFMDGIVGSFLLPMDRIEALWPWLWAAQWFHLGKGASMGMGAIRLRAEGT